MAIRGRFDESSRAATLGSTLAAHLCLIVWCKACRHVPRAGFGYARNLFGGASPIFGFLILVEFGRLVLIVGASKV